VNVRSHAQKELPARGENNERHFWPHRTVSARVHVDSLPERTKFEMVQKIGGRTASRTRP